VDYEHLLLDIRDHVGVIKLNRPEVLNAMNRKLFNEIDTAVGQLESDDDVRAIVLTGAGDRAFSAGADIHEMAEQARMDSPPPPDPRRSEYSWHIAATRKPTIGALNGLAFGGGAVLASSLDIRVGCERTRFRFLAVQYGRVNSTWSLPRQVGWPVAKELLFTARVVGAEEAARIGLLNHLVPSEKLMDKALELAGMIAENDPRMVQGVKELLIRDIGEDWRSHYQNELDAQAGKLAPTPVLEGFKPFLDRKGRN
jgi:enoyl-CoA hydratase/carnithine racemase